MKNDERGDEALASGVRGFRKPYSRPSISEVPLRLEEAVLGGCKTASAGGAISQTLCSAPSNCFDLSTS